jgi:hypothetical protein
MAQLKSLIVNGASRFIGDVYANTFTGNLSGTATYATYLGTSSGNYTYSTLHSALANLTTADSNLNSRIDNDELTLSNKISTLETSVSDLISWKDNPKSNSLYANCLYVGESINIGGAILNKSQYTGNAATASSVAWSGITGVPSYLLLSGGTMTGLLTATYGGSHLGLKAGSTYINAIDGSLIFQNNTALRFGGDSWDWNIWAGLTYVHSSKTIYLGLADGTVFTANSAQSGGTLELPGISSIKIANSATGTAPIQVTSTTKCSNLNADRLDGYHISILTSSAYSSATKDSSTIYFVTG